MLRRDVLESTRGDSGGGGGDSGGVWKCGGGIESVFGGECVYCICVCSEKVYICVCVCDSVCVYVCVLAVRWILCMYSEPAGLPGWSRFYAKLSNIYPSSPNETPVSPSETHTLLCLFVRRNKNHHIKRKMCSLHIDDN